MDEYSISSPVDEITHVFQTDAVVTQFEPPQIETDRPFCQRVEEWEYKVSSLDGSALPDGMSFDQQTLAFTVDQKVESPFNQTIDVLLEAKTDTIELLSPVKTQFKVKLVPAPKKEVFVDPDILSVMESEGVTISVEPTLSTTYSMNFDSIFEKSFTFSIEPDTTKMEIKIGGGELPYIKTSLSESTVYISIDGPQALLFTKATITEKASFDIKVNHETFTFKIQMSKAFAGVQIFEPEIDKTSQLIYDGLPDVSDSEETRREIKADITSIEKNGEITISYNPPDAYVPESWKQLFLEENLAKLSLEERGIVEEQALDLIHVVFLKNSYESEQRYFLSNLTDFTSAGLKIRLNFSDPLLVSQGESRDQIVVKIHKQYFMNPNPLS